MGKELTPKKRVARRTSVQKAVDEVISSELTEKQKLFCLLYTTDARCFGNASASYALAYDLRTDKEKKNARHHGWRMATNEHIKTHIKELYKAVFTTKGADDSLTEIMTQRKDLNARLGAIREYNKLKNRVSDRHEITGKDGGPIEITGVKISVQKHGA